MMQRTKSNRHPEDQLLLKRGNTLYYGKPNLILCSDLHLREDTPTCWVGDFQEEQWLCLQFIKDLQAQYGCPVVHSGDLFDYWKPSPWLLRMAMKHIPNDFYTIYGQHDLPQHNWKLRGKSGIAALEEAGRVKVLDGCHWGMQPENLKMGMSAYWESDDTFYPLVPNKRMLVWHHLTYLKPPFPGATGGLAEGIIRKYKQFDLIVTGDNHQAFTIEYNGRRLVNPGNMTRQTAKQIDFKPRVYLWYAEDNSVKPVFLPIKEGVISREHIEQKEERENRISAFISKLNTDYDTSVTFKKNLERFFKVNKIEKPIMDIIYKSLDK